MRTVTSRGAAGGGACRAAAAAGGERGADGGRGVGRARRPPQPGRARHPVQPSTRAGGCHNALGGQEGEDGGQHVVREVGEEEGWWWVTLGAVELRGRHGVVCVLCGRARKGRARGGRVGKTRGELGCDVS